jgi:hypothetical protein
MSVRLSADAVMPTLLTTAQTMRRALLRLQLRCPTLPDDDDPCPPRVLAGTRCFDSMSRPTMPAGQARQIPFAKDPCPTWPVYPSDRSNRIQHGASSALRPQPHRVLSFLCQTRPSSTLLPTSGNGASLPVDTARRHSTHASRTGRRPREPPDIQTDPAHPGTVYLLRP